MYKLCSKMIYLSIYYTCTYAFVAAAGGVEGSSCIVALLDWL